jgi:hypothetical protein
MSIARKFLAEGDGQPNHLNSGYPKNFANKKHLNPRAEMSSTQT